MRRMLAVVLALAIAVPASAARVTTVDTVIVEGELDWGDGLARDIGASAAVGGTITYGFGDTLSHANADGTLCSNSVARASTSTPLALTETSCNGTTDQTIAYTSAEATWNLEGSEQHSYRHALPIVGAVAEGSDVRLFYARDQALYDCPGCFYAGFPMVKLGTCLLAAAAATCTRDTGTEVDIPADEWPSGFHRAADGSVRFFMEEADDAVVYRAFKRGRWTAAGGFTFSAQVAFRLDAAFGIWPFYSTRQGQWLATYIDRAGRVRLTALTGSIAPGSSVLYQIASYTSLWRGYAANRIDGADAAGGAEFLVAYTAIPGGFLAGDMPVLRVTLE